MNTSQEMYNEMILHKVKSVKEKLKKEHENYKKIQRKKMIEEKNKFNTMVDRLLSNEMKFQSFILFYFIFSNKKKMKKI